MTWNDGSKVFAVLLGLGVLADARAATLTLDRDVVPLGGSIVFHVTTEHELMEFPLGVGYGPEAPLRALHERRPPRLPRRIDLQLGLQQPVRPGLRRPFPVSLVERLDQLLQLQRDEHGRALRGDAGLLALRRSGSASRLHSSTCPSPSFPRSSSLEVTPRRIPVGGTVTLSADVNLGQPANHRHRLSCGNIVESEEIVRRLLC